MSYLTEYRAAIVVAVLLAICTAITHLGSQIFVDAGLDPVRIQAWGTIALSILGAIALFLPRLQATPTATRLTYEQHIAHADHQERLQRKLRDQTKG